MHLFRSIRSVVTSCTFSFCTFHFIYICRVCTVLVSVEVLSVPQTFSPLCEWNHRPSSLRLTFARRRRINNFRPPHLNFRWVNQRRSERCRGRRWNVNKANCSITCRTLLPPPPPSAWQRGCTLSLCDFVRLHQVNRWVNKLVFTWCFQCIGLILR